MVDGPVKEIPHHLKATEARRHTLPIQTDGLSSLLSPSTKYFVFYFLSVLPRILKKEVIITCLRKGLLMMLVRKKLVRQDTLQIKGQPQKYHQHG